MLNCLQKEELISFLYDVRYVFLFYVIGDWITTIYALNYGFEVNIVTAFVIEKYGVFYILVLKFLFMGLFFGTYRVTRHYPRLWRFTTGTIAGVGLLVSLWNLTVIFLGLSVCLPPKGL
ncbi:hypothetical protein FTO70_06110 [Methanosarcina sp. KYL-1]|uniref:DUF5658 family protein n=1 Tax=Methanosarcina sp. KYL-1 TaxID=2602068 RepID=UPI0021007142|nr:DUF5658 family protein [Methanosarcina sp. KYL-1]MCQ1535270.1 hypothetical protein [Methanosarcina sp. KYL-1]